MRHNSKARKQIVEVTCQFYYVSSNTENITKEQPDFFPSHSFSAL